jgi:hypothetical protein
VVTFVGDGDRVPMVQTNIGPCEVDEQLLGRAAIDLGRRLVRGGFFNAIVY